MRAVRSTGWMAFCIVGLLVLIFWLAGCGANSAGSPSSGGAGSSSSENAAMGTTTKVTITEKVAAGQDDVYAFSSPSITIKAGDSVSFTNQTDEMHTLKCTPDAGIGQVKVDENETMTVTFSKPGTYMLSSKEHPDARMMITVEG